MAENLKQKSIKLSLRLQTIVDMADNCERVIDVGTDHALIPIYFVLNKKAQTAIGTDIKKGPVKRAEKNINNYKVTDKIKIIHTNGLENVDVTSKDCIVISGMGGYEIISILEKMNEFPKEFILQPQKSAYELREYLSMNGFEIVEEKIAMESHRFYIILKALYKGENYKLNSLQKYIGPKILIYKPLFYKEYLNHLHKKLKKEIEGNKQLIEIIKEVESELIK